MKTLLREHGAKLTLLEECRELPRARCSGSCGGKLTAIATLLDGATGRAQLEATDDAGMAPLSVAAARGQVEATRLLLSLLLPHGAKFKKADGKSGAAALSAAAEGGHVEVARLLLERGATADGKSGATNAEALRLAKGNKMKDLLREHGATLTLEEECRDGNVVAIKKLLNVNGGADGKPFSAIEFGGQLAALDDEANHSDRSLSGESGRLNRALSGESGRATGATVRV